MEFFVIWIFFAVLIGWWADSRGRNWFAFAVISLLASPLLAGIILLVTKNLAQVKVEEAAKREEDAKRENERREDHDRQLESIKALARTGPAGGGSVADELSKLAQLKRDGVLSDDEFAAQKAILLGGRSSS